MKKEECIRRYGEATWAKWVKQSRKWGDRHREEKNRKQSLRHAGHHECENAKKKKWREANPKKVIVASRQSCRKGGKYYEQKVKYNTTGLQGERFKIRKRHAKQYRPFKQLIAPKSQIHHEWIPGTAKYRGMALVETDQHMHGFVDVIQILDGKITLFTEKEIGKGVITT